MAIQNPQTQTQYIRALEDENQQLRERVRSLELRLQSFQQSGLQHSTSVQRQPSTPIRRQPAVQFDRWVRKPKVVLPSQDKKSTKKPTISALSTLLTKIPLNEEGWLERRKLVNLSEPAQLVQTLCLLTRFSSQPCPSSTIDKRGNKSGILDILEDYGRFTSRLEIHKIYTTQISNYSTVIFICMTVVALHCGADLNAVNASTLKCLREQQGSCEAGEEYFQRLRKSALWPVQRTKELYKKGVGHRASELFVLCGPSIHTYNKYPSNGGGFMDQVSIPKPPDSDHQADIPFDITFLIKIILGKTCSLNQINAALDTSLSEDRFEAWAKALGSIILESMEGRTNNDYARVLGDLGIDTYPNQISSPLNENNGEDEGHVSEVSEDDSTNYVAEYMQLINTEFHLDDMDLIF